ncbi:v-type proton ATPase subunit G [Striga asiatica]|uniref:V-type proton ATPase subunit G n=1 Tax=Striga asiatica TaxID=4170 RepID=A0A5A7PYS5_STRAF|nr:v-type proton ATPase subunit G [Striga asiatica]
MDPTRGGQGGIQMLLTAEQEAQQIVTSARNLKMARLKQAKEEADKEAANFRSHMEAEYKKSISESSGSSDSTVKRLEAETDAKVESLKATTSKVSPEVVKMLCNFITSVKN